MCDKRGDFYKDRKETKKTWTEISICLQEDSEALGDVQRNAFGEYMGADKSLARPDLKKKTIGRSPFSVRRGGHC